MLSFIPVNLATSELNFGSNGCGKADNCATLCYMRPLLQVSSVYLTSRRQMYDNSLSSIKDVTGVEKFFATRFAMNPSWQGWSKYSFVHVHLDSNTFNFIDHNLVI